VWDDCHNVRDLGGLPTTEGRRTRWGAVVRSDSRERLTAAGWVALRAHGVRTIVDLRDPAEYDRSAALPSSIDLVRAPVLDLGDGEFWGEGRWQGAGQSADFFLAALRRWPSRFAKAVRAVARARPGGVLIHCQAGRDRTGIVAAAILTLAGVSDEAIVADYAASATSLGPLYEQWAADAMDTSERQRILAANRSDERELRRVLTELDLSRHIVDGGLSAADVRRLRARLVG